MMRILPPDEKERFSISFDSNLIRTGSNSDGACFFYSMNLAFRDFREASLEEKKEFIENQRRTLASELTLSDWMSINHGHFCFLQLLYTMRNCIFILNYLGSGKANPHDKQRWIEDWGKFIQEDSFEIWLRFFPVEYVDNELFNNWHNHLSECKVITIESISSSLKTLCGKHMDKLFESSSWKRDLFTEEQKISLKEGIYEFWGKLLSQCISNSLSLQKQRIETYHTWADMDTILSITPYLPYDLIFIHSESKDVYFDTQTISSEMDEPSSSTPETLLDTLPVDLPHDLHHDEIETNDDKANRHKSLESESDREVLILLYYPDCHFENVGRIVSNEDGKQKIIRVFQNDDEFVRELRMKN